MLTYDFTNRNNKTLYEMLYNYIKNDIICGILKYKEKLPSKRTLAEHLSVSVVTVQNAYEQLIAEGYISAEEKRGYYVNNIGILASKNEETKECKPKEKQEYWVDFVTNKMDENTMAFSSWIKIMRVVIAEQDKKLLQSIEFRGVYELRKAISDYLHQFRGISADPQQIIVGSGTEYLYNLLIQLMGRDATYGFENPGYRKLQQIFKLNGVKNRAIDIDHEGLSVEKLKKSDVSVIHISPAHHYPTGVTMPIGRRQELLKWSADGMRYIIEDDYDSEFRYSGKPIETLFGIDTNSKVIYVNTFSKTISPSFRISYMILPKHLMQIFENQMSFYSCTVPSIEQYTLAKFIADGYFERHINRSRKLYRQKRDMILDLIRTSKFSEKIKVYEENAGLHFVMKIDTQLKDEDIKKMARDAGINIAFLSEYLYKENAAYDHYAIINYSSIQKENLSTAMTVLENKIYVK